MDEIVVTEPGTSMERMEKLREASFNEEVFGTPVLFLDLDGTVRKGFDQLGHWVNRPEDVELFPGVADRIAEWRTATKGRVVFVTNQGGIALGLADPRLVVEAIQRTSQLLLAENPNATVELFEMCPHHPDAAYQAWRECGCRKPLPGMVYNAINKLMFHAQMHNDFEFHPFFLHLMVGDRQEDSACANSANIEFMSAENWRAGGERWQEILAARSAAVKRRNSIVIRPPPKQLILPN